MRRALSRSAAALLACGAPFALLSPPPPLPAPQEPPLPLRAGTPPRAGPLSDTIGATPLLEVGSLSRATGCRILVKCEHMNPGLSVKDRAA